MQFKGSELGLVPPTGMAAHAVDEGLETMEVEGDLDVFETVSAAVEKGATYGMPGLPFPLPPPPPPLSHHAYSKVTFLIFGHVIPASALLLASFSSQNSICFCQQF